MSELSQGTKINGRYTLQEYKGSGSFGEVWLAHDDIIDTDVALKIYVSLNPAGISQFTEEYKTTANLSHPNLLTAKHFDVWERRPFLEMKYCGQGSADKLVGNITEKELWHFIHDVAAGLHYLHDLPEPIIHQDIKPDNVLMDDDGMFLITDFGISKQLRATIRKQSGRSDASGSCAYMGPERFNADPTPIKASDIWSLGASMYELAKGELPFYGQGGVMLKNGADLPELGAGWSSELNQTIQACLAKDPWNRPTAEQLEKYAESMLQSLETGRAITWTPAWIKNTKKDSTPIRPSATSNATIPIVKQDTPKNDSSNTPISNTDNKKSSKNNEKIFGISALIVLLCILIGFGLYNSINKTSEDNNGQDKTISTTNNDTLPVKAKKKSGTTTPLTPNIKESDDVKNTSKQEPVIEDTSALRLKKALKNGDYASIQELANSGYAPSYVPLAKYYLNNNEYDLAHEYAKKARNKGQKGAQSIINQLDNLGYFD